MIRIFLLITLIASVFVYFPAPVAHACSGTASTLEQLVANSAVIVKASVVASDASEQHNILRIETYLQGTGGEYLLLTRNEADFIARANLGFVQNGECDWLYPALSVGTSGYFFLNRRIHGDYQTTAYEAFNPAYYSFPYTFSTDSGEDLTLTEGEFLLHLEVTPTPPDFSQPHPLPAPLILTTEAGDSYILPMDGGTLLPLPSTHQITYTGACSEMGCTTVSANGVFQGTMQSNGINFRYGGGILVEGDGFIFAPDAPLVAVWTADELTIYSIDLENLTSQATTVLNTPPQNLLWSADSTHLAYANAEGLWVWDIVGSEQATLISMDATLIPIRFSPQNAVLTVQNGSELQSIASAGDLQDVFPDGLFSPTDDLLLAFDTQQPSTVELEVSICMLDCGEVLGKYRHPQWRDAQTALWVACPDGECVVQEVNLAGSPEVVAEYRGYAYAYSPPGDALAVVESEHTIRVGDMPYDLSAQLTSPISTIEWGDMIFVPVNE